MSINVREKPRFRGTPSPITVEALETRRLASVSYVRVGKEIQPDIVAQVPSYFAVNLPAGEYLIAVVGGSLTYYDGAKPPLYSVNNYNESDHGFKVVEPGGIRFDAPGLSSPARANSVVAARDSVGVYLKFYHATAGKIGIEIYDDPVDDNAAGKDGSPVFVLKEREVTPTPASAESVAAAAIAPSPTASFSSTPIAATSLDLETASQDALDLLI